MYADAEAWQGSLQGGTPESEAGCAPRRAPHKPAARWHLPPDRPPALASSPDSHLFPRPPAQAHTVRPACTAAAATRCPVSSPEPSCRRLLCSSPQELGLPVDPRAPLLGFIGRLDFQKGVDLIADNYEWLMQVRRASCKEGRRGVHLQAERATGREGQGCPRAQRRRGKLAGDVYTYERRAWLTGSPADLLGAQRLADASSSNLPAFALAGLSQEGAQLVLLGSGREDLEAALRCWDGRVYGREKVMRNRQFGDALRTMSGCSGASACCPARWQQRGLLLCTCAGRWRPAPHGSARRGWASASRWPTASPQVGPASGSQQG